MSGEVWILRFRQMKWHNLFKVAWLAACFGVLAWSFLHCRQESNLTLRSECSFLATSMMMVLTLPSGLAWVSLVSAMAYMLSLMGLEVGGAPFTFEIFMWLGFVVVGYVQWFLFVPWLTRRMRERRGKRPPKVVVI